MSSLKSWPASIDWATPAGVTLRRLMDELSPERQWSLTLFGSSPLQLAIEPTFASRDVDLFTFDDSRDAIAAAIKSAGLDDREQGVYVQLCEPGNFRTTPHWFRRAHSIQVGHVSLTLPHPIDLLVAKLHRLEEKDLQAFRLVIDRMGHPTEAEMRRELQASVDLFRPNFDEEMVGDITSNTRLLWHELWGKEINVRREIIAPALEARRKGYEPDIPQRDFKAELRKLGEE